MKGEDIMSNHTMETTQDQEVLKKFKYKQELNRSLKLFSAFAFAFSAISLTTGIFMNFGFVMSTIGSVGIWTFPLVGIGSILVAIIFGEISTHVPITGHCYMWITKLHSKRMGWIIGWTNFCYLIIILPSINTALAPVILSLIGLPVTAHSVALVAEIALTLQLLLNVLSIKTSSAINCAAVVTESLGVLLLTVVLGICAFRNGAPLSNTMEVLPALAGKSLFLPVLMSFLLGFYTLVGFESAANMSEETHNAVKNVPRAMISSISLSTIFGALFLFALTMAVKNFDKVAASASPIPLVIESNLGPVIGKLFLIIICISIFACGLVFMTSASRTVYAMSRDNAFFASGLFKKVSPKTATPIPACLLFWVIGTIFLNTTTPTILAVASAALPSLYYLLTIICYAQVRKNLPPVPGAFHMKKWGKPIIAVAILWLAFGFSILSFPKDFRSATIVNVAFVGVGLLLYYVYFGKKVNAVDPEIIKS